MDPFVVDTTNMLQVPTPPRSQEAWYQSNGMPSSQGSAGSDSTGSPGLERSSPGTRTPVTREAHQPMAKPAPPRSTIAQQLEVMDTCAQDEGLYHSCDNPCEFWDAVACKLSGPVKPTGRELELHVRVICHERRECLLRGQIPPRREEYEKLDIAIDAWLQIEGRRILERCVQGIRLGYLLTFGPEESSYEHILSEDCLDKLKSNTEHMKMQRSKKGRAGRVTSVRLVRAIESIEANVPEQGPKLRAITPDEFYGPTSRRFRDSLSLLLEHDVDGSRALRGAYPAPILGKLAENMPNAPLDMPARHFDTVVDADTTPEPEDALYPPLRPSSHMVTTEISTSRQNIGAGAGPDACLDNSRPTHREASAISRRTRQPEKGQEARRSDSANDNSLKIRTTSTEPKLFSVIDSAAPRLSTPSSVASSAGEVFRFSATPYRQAYLHDESGQSASPAHDRARYGRSPAPSKGQARASEAVTGRHRASGTRRTSNVARNITPIAPLLGSVSSEPLAGRLQPLTSCRDSQDQPGHQGNKIKQYNPFGNVPVIDLTESPKREQLKRETTFGGDNMNGAMNISSGNLVSLVSHSVSHVIRRNIAEFEDRANRRLDIVEEHARRLWQGTKES
ncbi:Uu.00g036730.m01.CDS01 [Anthostomella pinea]|uniref:Uu.00g036730.m01.CDS01 n=1 Tax=Anthostomella pinea TaxID=933095 RepID=A0AAI8YDK0_9PEZI|nr:Uu.00g036730.m01.CDS01 [Anthostomella pinea]